MESLLASASFPLLFIFACSFDFALGGLVEYMRGPQHTMLCLVTDRDYLWRHLISIYFIFLGKLSVGFCGFVDEVPMATRLCVAGLFVLARHISIRLSF